MNVNLIPVNNNLILEELEDQEPKNNFGLIVSAEPSQVGRYQVASASTSSTFTAGNVVFVDRHWVRLLDTPNGEVLVTHEDKILMMEVRNGQ